jgi:hypothetical protein
LQGWVARWGWVTLFGTGDENKYSPYEDARGLGSIMSYFNFRVPSLPVRIRPAVESVTLLSVTLWPFKSKKEGWLPGGMLRAEGGNESAVGC